MKKTAAILFIILYYTLTAGMTMAMHFCGGKVTSVQMLPFFPKENPCGCDDITFPDNCCKTEIKTFHLNDEQIIIHSEQQSSPQTDVNLWAEISKPVSLSSDMVCLIDQAHSPPESPPSYILQHAFLI